MALGLSADEFLQLGLGIFPGFDEHSTRLSVSLERYMEDVLIACYLMTHLIAGLVREGAPTEAKWVQKLQDAVFSSSSPPASRHHEEDTDDAWLDDDNIDDDDSDDEQLPRRLNATGW